MEYIVLLSDGKSNPNLLGGKGLNLIKLIEAGINVPPGFVININAYENFLKETENTDKLNEILSITLEPKKIMQVSADIQDLILKSEIPKEIIDEIKVAYDQTCEITGDEVYFAVRSSATVEDSSKFSFAGQADSFLYNKSFDDILNSLKKCWASLYSPRALLYLLQMRKKGFDLSLKDVRMAVVVQKMINSEISGVLFTANIVTNNESQMYLNSTWGLGDPIANNSINPDTIILNKDKFEVIKIIIGKKEKKSIQNPEGSGTIMIDTDPEYRSVCSMNENQLRQVQSLGLRIENLFKWPQDIELAIEKDVLYTLQARPITTLKK